MEHLSEINSVEQEYVDEGEPCLDKSLALLKKAWEAGPSREAALRLMFLLWYSLAEARFLTGLEPLEAGDSELFKEVFRHLCAECPGDLEFAFVYLAQSEVDGAVFSAFELDSEPCAPDKARLKALVKSDWEANKARLREAFLDKGLYGSYFSEMLDAL
jgi:hypothetical protein